MSKQEGSGKNLPPRQLWICSSENCSSDLVQPLSSQHLRDDSWRLNLKCPDCGHEIEGDFTQSEVDEFDDYLAEATDDMVALIHELDISRMREEVEIFIGCLITDSVLPEDFKA